MSFYSHPPLGLPEIVFGLTEPNSRMLIVGALRCYWRNGYFLPPPEELVLGNPEGLKPLHCAGSPPSRRVLAVRPTTVSEERYPRSALSREDRAATV
jgi:hypothetical protein